MRTPLRVLSALVLMAACRDEPTGPAIGTLEVVVSGVPGAAAVQVTVSSTAGFSQVVTATTTLVGIPSGRYVLTAERVVASEDVFAVPAPIEVRLRRGKTVEAVVPYVLASGTLSFVTTGLPDGATTVATLSGPGNAEREVVVPGVARGLVAGEWTVLVAPATADGHGWSATAPAPIAVTASATPVEIPVGFALATGAINLAFTGLPDGVERRAVIYGAVRNGTRRVDTVSADGVVTNLAPGVTSISPLLAYDADIQYLAPGATIAVAVGLTPLDVPLAYTARTGRIAITASGLPDSLAGAARVTGPSGFDVVTSASDTLRGVPSGTYQVKGVLVADASAVYGSAGATVVVVSGATTSDAAVAFAPDLTMNLAVEAAYLVQSVQNVAGDVPLVAGRSALLRIFGVASADNAFDVPVRARLLNGAVPVFDTTVAPNASGVPTVTNQGTFTRSWNVTVPGDVIQPGLTLEVVLDPNELLPEAERGDNSVLVPLDVRTLAPFRARLVPIQFITGETGDVTAANAETFLAPTRAMLPVDSVDWDLRDAYVTNYPLMTTSNGDIWSDILSQLYLLRVADASDRHYLGVVPVGYSSGIAGIGYVGLPANLSWDYLPSGAGTLAHELGHNFGRLHAPCGGPSGVDPNYPYPGATIGVFGYDAATGALKPPSSVDLMSYCSDEWISDYTYRAVFEFRRATEAFVQAGGTGAALLVSGRITRSGIVLDPVFTVTTAAALPRGGPHRLTLRDAEGRTLFDAAFAGSAVADLGDGGDEHFAFAIPLAALAGREAASITVAARGARAELRQPSTFSAGARAVATRAPDGTVEVSWPDPAVRGLIVRDAGTGRIISIVRGASTRLPADTRELDVLASDGLHTRTSRVRPEPR